MSTLLVKLAPGLNLDITTAHIKGKNSVGSLIYLDKNNTDIYGIILCMFPTFNKKLYIDIIDT